MNHEEMTIGGIFGLCFIPLIGFWAVFLAPVTALLWALSGAGFSKLFRRLAVPFLACLAVFLCHRHWQVWAAFPMAFGVLSIGYGVPDNTDKGSVLGRFWQNIHFRLEEAGSAISDREKFVEFWTRTTIYILLGISFIPALF